MWIIFYNIVYCDYAGKNYNRLWIDMHLNLSVTLNLEIIGVRTMKSNGRIKNNWLCRLCFLDENGKIFLFLISNWLTVSVLPNHKSGTFHQFFKICIEIIYVKYTNQLYLHSILSYINILTVNYDGIPI